MQDPTVLHLPQETPKPKVSTKRVKSKTLGAWVEPELKRKFEAKANGHVSDRLRMLIHRDVAPFRYYWAKLRRVFGRR